MRPAVILAALVIATGARADTPKTAPTEWQSRAVPLPGASGAVNLDYVAFDRTAGRLWVPAGNTGSVDVSEPGTDRMTRIAGFPTAEKEIRGQKRTLGPSSVAIGTDFAYVGNRANSQICAVDLKTLEQRNCATLASSPDGVAWVGAAKEVWVTTPRDNSLTLLDASLKPVGRVPLPGGPEGYAVDDANGRFYTNLEDKDQTLQIDVHTRQIVSTWKPECGAAGPRGIAVDGARKLVLVACTDHAAVLDIGHGGTLVGKADTGAGVDNIDYLATRQWLYVASGAASRLSVFHVDDGGHLALVATGATAERVRTVVADAKGAAYAPDGMKGRILVFTPPK
jgi:DNA-binding beta-propeller fold protein YncE